MELCPGSGFLDQHDPFPKWCGWSRAAPRLRQGLLGLSLGAGVLSEVCLLQWVALPAQATSGTHWAHGSLGASVLGAGTGFLLPAKPSGPVVWVLASLSAVLCPHSSWGSSSLHCGLHCLSPSVTPLRYLVSSCHAPIRISLGPDCPLRPASTLR